MQILRACVVFLVGLIAWPADASQFPAATCDADVSRSVPLLGGAADDEEALWRSAAAVASPDDAQVLLVPAAHAARGSAGAALAGDPALDEMLRGPRGRVVRWTEPPSLVVLMSVMEYRSGTHTEYEATSERLTEADAADLVTDLTRALALLTGGTYTQFASVRREIVAPGTRAIVVRPGQIVVGRYRGLRDRLETIGVGGRIERGGTIRGGSIMLDTEYDRASGLRRLLRTHELGHALGYNHVNSRTSIMNPRIGSEPTDFDRRAALWVFERASIEAPPDPCAVRGLRD